MKIKHKAPAVIICITLLITCIAAYSNYMSNFRLIERAKQRELETVSNLIQNTLVEQSNSALSRAALVANLPPVKSAFRAGDRKVLGELLEKTFLLQRAKYGVEDAEFDIAPAVSFLRLYDLLNFGEDLSSFREMILVTNQKHESQRGVEIGRNGVSVRGVAVVKDDAGPIGSFEVVMGYDAVLQSIKQNTGFEVGVFVEEESMAKIAKRVAKPDADHIISGYRAVITTDWDKIKSLITTDVLPKINDITYKIQTVGGVDYGVAIVPLLDYKGLKIGYTVAVGDFGLYQNMLKTSLVSSIAFCVMQAIVLGGMFSIIFNALLIKPINALNIRMQELTRALYTGESEDPLSQELDENIERLKGMEDEIGMLSNNVDRLKDFIAKHLPQYLKHKND